MKFAFRVALSGICVAVLGCGDSDPLGPVVSPVITVTVNSMNSSDIEAGVIDKDENISNGTGNPWSDFLRQAGEVCGGDPAGFGVAQASLALDADGSSNVDALDEVFSGNVSIIFRSTRGNDASAVQVEIASGPVSGTGPFALTISATRGGLSVLQDRLTGGDFHVAVRGVTNRDSGDDFSMAVRATFTVAAFCR